MVPGSKTYDGLVNWYQGSEWGLPLKPESGGSRPEDTAASLKYVLSLVCYLTAAFCRHGIDWKTGFNKAAWCRVVP